MAHISYQPDPQGRGAWSDGCCSCFSDLGSACKTWWCPCLAVQDITTVAPEIGTCTEWMMFCCIGCCCGCAQLGCMFSEYGFRTRARRLYGIPGSDIGDCCTVWCCQCCALSQLHRHVRRYPPQNLGTGSVTTTTTTTMNKQNPAYAI